MKPPKILAFASVGLTLFAPTACTSSPEAAQYLIERCTQPNMEKITSKLTGLTMYGILRLDDGAKIRTTTLVSNNVASQVNTGDPDKCLFVPITHPLDYPRNDSDGTWYPLTGMDMIGAGIAPKKSDKQNDTFWVNDQRASMFCAGPIPDKPKCDGNPWAPVAE